MLQRIGNGSNGLPRGLHIQLHPSSQEVGGIQVAEHQGRVRDGRSCPSPSVAGWTGISARTVWADTEQATRVDPGDRAATRANAADIYGREAGHVSNPLTTEPGFTRGLYQAIPHQTDVEAGPTRITRDDIAAANLSPRIMQGSHRCERGTRADSINRTLRQLLNGHDATRRCCAENLATKAGATHILGNLTQMALHERFERGIDDGCRCPTIFTNNRVEPG